jgi:hypothetical protein
VAFAKAETRRQPTVLSIGDGRESAQLNSLLSRLRRDAWRKVGPPAERSASFVMHTLVTMIVDVATEDPPGLKSVVPGLCLNITPWRTLRTWIPLFVQVLLVCVLILAVR